MCSIIGFCDSRAEYEVVSKALAITKSRGPDDTRIVDTGSGYLGFNRLAIMGLTASGMQPFERDGSYVVCNGEIYDFRPIRKKLMDAGYTFKSESDCEILLPLWKELGTAMFDILDAEYALIIYDKNTDSYIAARDPIGIRPLYYGYAHASSAHASAAPLPEDGVVPDPDTTYTPMVRPDGSYLVFASEPKNLIGICDKIYPFPPGHYYKDGRFVCYRDMSKRQVYHHDSMEEISRNIHDLLISGVRKRLDSDTPVGFLLSGGLDSSLVCAISASLLDKPIETYAIGMDIDAIDLKYAREVADFIHANHHEVIISRNDVVNAVDDVIRILGTYDITTIRASIGMYLVCKAIHEQSDIRVLLTGEISDELFGYKYTDFAPNSEEFQREAEKRIRELHMYDVLRADRCISVNSLEARVPFGDLEFVKYVMGIDPEKKMNHYNKGKYLLRHAFEEDKILPYDILMREKAAFSDAVGHSLKDDLEAYASSRYTDEEFEERRKKYTHAQPFTKESLFYRETFEKYYPGQSQMVVDFWMPNKNWKGCSVNDPSARVLSNYGDSGK
ncbi:asparagine synthase (glutamine-hydrolyzing) [Oribacterium sp. HCP28S3_H8]|uniref:asparagine synthase (glutamine-hydrolyzing) n=1 Tax=Oribacterium sp. HCP28S3_H8 TaxID=3438945 RepID=UPI003F886A24